MSPRAFSLFVTFFVALTCFLCLGSMSSSIPGEKHTKVTNTNYVHIASNLINLVGNSSQYNKLLRPYFGGDPVVVYTSIVIDGIGPVSHEEMEFTMDFFFRQSWQDPRLAYTDSNHPYIQFGSEISDKIWKPDTYFLSAVRTSVHAGGSVNSLIRVHPEGRVLVSERLRATSKCFMILKFFPLDTQKCSLLVGSYGYTEDDIKYDWFANDPVSFNDGISTIQIPQFKYKKLSRKVATHQLSTGNYSYVQLSIYLERNIAVFLVQVYLPAGLIVTISWVTFWVKRNAVPARASIGVTAVLTMMTLTAGGVLRDPRFTEVTPMDIYIGVCFMYVVGALIEMAFVGYFDKPRYAPKDKQTFGKGLKNSSYLPIGLTLGMVSDQQPNTSFYGENYSRNNVAHSNWSECLNNSANDSSRYNCAQLRSKETEMDANASQTPAKETPSDAVKRELCHFVSCACKVSAPRIDILSRVVFPLTFFLFNAIYWIWFYNEAAKASSKLDEET